MRKFPIFYDENYNYLVMKKIYLLLVAMATVMTFMACHKEVEEKDDGYCCLVPPFEYFYFYIDKEDVSLANFKKELSIYKLTDQGKKRVDNIPEEEGTLESVEGDKNSDYISFVAVRTGLNNFGKREINYSLEGAGIAIKLTIRAELTDMGRCGTAIHIYEVLLNDKKWKPTIGKNKALIYTLKSSMFTVK